KRAVIADNLELTGLTRPFDTELWYGDRVAVLGGNGTGKSHFLRLLACGGTDPELDQLPVGDMIPEPVNHDGRLRLGARVRPGWFAQTHHHAGLMDRTLLDILHHGAKGAPGTGVSRLRESWIATGSRPRRADIRLAVRRAAGPLPDPAAGVDGLHPAAAR
ncbi:putative aBC transporter ATP-binding protein, partial [Mycobacteroides abscessus MAB_110811_1470]